MFDKISIFFSNLRFKFSLFLIFSLLISLTLKSATAALKIATSVGRFLRVSLNISSAVLTETNFTPSTGSKFVSPEISTVSKPLSLNDFAIS